MVVAEFDGFSIATVYGLTQWDYGQQMLIKGNALDLPDETEVQFFQGDLAATRYIHNGIVGIPDVFLQEKNEITAYVYVRNENIGETVLTIFLRIDGRPKPENYVLPDDKDYLRLIPTGGNDGQVLKKASDKDFDLKWGDSADGLKIVEGALQLMSGDRPIGDPVRVPGTGGREIEIKNDGTAIVWRYTDSNTWMDLVQLKDITGPAGEVPKFEIRNNHLIAIYKEG